MNLNITRQLALIVPLIGFCWFAPPVKAHVFEQREVNQQDFIAIARPYGNGKYDLLILQQFPNKRPCWSVSGSNPTRVTPLLLDFDFTGICDRATDSNGYSLRVDGQDLGLNYLLRIVERDGELFLVGTPRDPGKEEMIVGRTYGKAGGLLQIHLVEGWRFTRRAFRERVLGHVYLTASSSAIRTSPAKLATTAPENRSSIKEYTFTAPTPANTAPAPPSETLPPPPAPTGNLPPLPPPTNNNGNRIVPPPPPRNANRRNLSNTVGLNPPANSVNTPGGGSSRGFRVVVQVNGEADRSRVRALYPDAFTTNFQGRSFLQIGVFGTRNNAESALQSLSPLRGAIVPF